MLARLVSKFIFSETQVIRLKKTMSYFTKEYLQFLSELTLNNDREWFNANKARFKEKVEAPFKIFIKELIDQTSAVDPRINITEKEAIFRIYKDVRFSKDKTPYKTHMTAAIGPGGRKGDKIGGIYLHLGADHFRIYTGFYMPTPKQVQLVREAIVSDMKGFKSIIEEPNFKKLFGLIQGDEHKRIPKEFAELIEKQPLLQKKSYYAFHEFKPEAILKKDLLEVCMAHFIAAQPLGFFFDQAVK